MSTADVNFVHSLHAQANEGVNKKYDSLFMLIVAFCIGFLLWAAFAKLDELARGEGKVIPSEKIQTVQNLDGGIVAEILVKEGEHVSKEQSLMKIDTTRFRASLEENRQLFWKNQVSKIRLEAEFKLNPKHEIPALKFPEELQNNAAGYIANEVKLYTTKVQEFKSNLKVLENQLGQKVQEMVELKSKLKQLKGKQDLVNEEYVTVAKLVKSGSKSKIELITIKKDLNNIDGEVEATRLAVPRAEYAIQEVKNRILEKLENYKSEVAKELQTINSDIKKYESILVSEKDKLDKTEIKSPVNGFIKAININTIGGVVKSGMDLIEIVPDSDVLLVEAKIDPKDIAFINPSQRAIVKITAYDFSIYGGLEGEIIEISADSIIDKESKDQKSYYKVVVRTNKNYLEKNGQKLPIIPGMIASIDIVTGKKTILDFLLKPILKTKQNAMHER